MITSKTKDHQVVMSPWCGEIREILAGPEYPALSVAVALNIRATRAHFHRGFDEVYFVLDGSLQLQLHDPDTGRTWTETLNPNELCVITKGTHHRVVSASEANRLCVLCVPRFDPTDETSSDRI
jgi:mannose-6-phosphate isomerase-like protein (cupin superfamily)